MDNVHGIQIQGGTLPTEMWRKFMQAVTANTDPGTFPDPGDLYVGTRLNPELSTLSPRRRRRGRPRRTATTKPGTKGSTKPTSTTKPEVDHEPTSSTDEARIANDHEDQANDPDDRPKQAKPKHRRGRRRDPAHRAAKP